MRLILAACAALCLLAGPATFPAFAQTSPTVTAPAAATAATAAEDTAVIVAENPAVVIPFGSWISGAADLVSDIILPVLLGLLALASRSLPFYLRAFVGTKQVEQILARAVDYGLQAVHGAAKGKVLTIPVGHAVIAEATQYAIDQGPAWLIKWVGGPENLKRMILARLDLVPETDATSVGVAPPPRAKGVVMGSPRVRPLDR